MPKKKVVNLAMIGCGGIAGTHLRRYQDLIKAGEDRFRIAATVDTVLDRAKAFARTINADTGWEVKSFKTIEQLLNSGLDLDGADICGPHGLHHVMACDLLNGGVNIHHRQVIGQHLVRIEPDAHRVLRTEHLNRTEQVLFGNVISIQGQQDDVEVDVAVQYHMDFTETVRTFANNINTQEGGTHLSGFRSALTRTLNAYANKNQLSKDLKDSVSGDDIREGLVAVVSVKIPEPQFEGQTKTKLGNTAVKGIVEAIINDKLGAFCEENPAVTKRIVNKAIDAARAREAARRAPSAFPSPSGSTSNAKPSRPW